MKRRMRRESHVRCCESLEVKFLRATRQIPSSGIRFGRAVDFTGFGGQEIAAPSIGGRGKDNARCFCTLSQLSASSGRLKGSKWRLVTRVLGLPLWQRENFESCKLELGHESQRGYGCIHAVYLVFWWA